MDRVNARVLFVIRPGQSIGSWTGFIVRQRAWPALWQAIWMDLRRMIRRWTNRD